MEQLGLKLVLIWAVHVTGCGITLLWHNTGPNLDGLKNKMKAHLFSFNQKEKRNKIMKNRKLYRKSWFIPDAKYPVPCSNV